MESATPAYLHMLFFPYMAQGHMLPMVDMAKLFAARGASVTILTTPANAAFIRPTTEGSDTPISLHLIPFPSVAAGLPEGCENRAFLQSDSMRSNFYRAIAMLRRPFDETLRELHPDCVVTDMFMPWTYHVAAKRGIPRLLFDGFGLISHCIEDVLDRHQLLETNLPPDADSFLLPGLPHRIEIFLSQTMEYSIKKQWPGREEFEGINRERKEVNPKNYGVLVNSFYELEPEYVEYYRKMVGRKAWHVGPVALFGQNSADKKLRGSGGHVSAGPDKSLEWLGRQKPGSVVYVCFGSASFAIKQQIREIAAGLEAAGHPFLWVVRTCSEELLPEGFEQRIVSEGKGMVIWGWAQQLEILNHVAAGGFVTHCGWNSTLEGISAGLPMVTWPLFADQFTNEKLLVDVAKVGVAVGSRVNSMKAEERTLVMAGAVEEAGK